MIQKQQDSLRWLESSLLGNFLTLRHASFLKPHSEGLPDFMPSHKCCRLKQVHGNVICDVSLHSPEVAPEGDALVTRDPQVVLSIKHADCQAALFYDPIQKVIAAAHCGWRGSVQNIYGKLIQHLQKNYACRTEDLYVFISPSLGPDHAEFIHYREELPPAFWKFQTRPSFFDFWAISRWQLEQAGIEASHIEVAEKCTYANSCDFHSYRRDQTKERHVTLLMMNGG